MVPSRKKRPLKRRLFCQLEDFGQGIIIGNTMSDSQGNVLLKANTVGQEFSVNISGINLATNEKPVKILETCFIERTDMELGNFVNCRR